MSSIRDRFTRWYVKRGYGFGYDFSDCKILGEQPFPLPYGVPRAVWKCPWWVRPFLVLFSPSAYTRYAIGDKIAEWIAEGIREGEAAGVHIDLS